MALKGLKVLEFVGLAPAPFCGKILADFGASVTRIDKVAENHMDVQRSGKRTLAINLKAPEGQSLAQRLAQSYDVLIEPFRPGVMEKLNLGPERLCAANSRLIYARLTGFGQTGRLAKRAGHDINYAAISGVLSMLGRSGTTPNPPVNILADFAGGGLMCALGICLALLERHRSGAGQVVDAAMVDGAAYVASWLFSSRVLPIWEGGARGQNTLDGGAFFYDTYETKDGLFMSVGALEPEFFQQFIELIELPDLSQYADNDVDRAAAKAAVRGAFLRKTQAEWSLIFEDHDACVYPVVEWRDVMQHDHNATRESFQLSGDAVLPKPAPRLSRTPGQLPPPDGGAGATYDEALSLLSDIGVGGEELQGLIDRRIVLVAHHNSKL